ncbi:hypothetical protein, partial [Escherichia coli]|uniref:hypothetical protein n=1 Tax=Escherichia coli TaxID=562 RepID=UPI00201A932C
MTPEKSRRDAKRRQRRVQYPPFDQLPEQLFLPPGKFVLCGAELRVHGTVQHLQLFFHRCCERTTGDA